MMWHNITEPSEVGGVQQQLLVLAWAARNRVRPQILVLVTVSKICRTCAQGMWTDVYIPSTILSQHFSAETKRVFKFYSFLIFYSMKWHTITEPSVVEDEKQQLLVLAWAARQRCQAWALTYYSAALSFRQVHLCSEKH